MFAVVSIPRRTRNLLNYLTGRFPHLSHWNSMEDVIQTLSPSSEVKPPTNLAKTLTHIPCSSEQAEGESGLTFFENVSDFSAYMRENSSTWQEYD